jgi:hypothetical protein
MIVGFLFRGACVWIWGNSWEKLKTTMEKFLVTLGNIVKVFFRWFFKLHKNSLLLFTR